MLPVELAQLIGFNELDELIEGVGLTVTIVDAGAEGQLNEGFV